MDLNGKSILITGGTGSFGRAFIKTIRQSYQPRRIVVYSRDELKQYDFRNELGPADDVRWFIGDVRDAERLKRAMKNVDIVIHAAALKQVDTAEYNPFECLQTNVFGAENVVNAAIDSDVEKVVALSTDKASSPINLYGASKLCSDKLFVAGNHYAASGRTRFSIVRYGNVVGSRGSVVPFFKRLAENPDAAIPITDRRMTRFWITLDQAVDFVLSSLAVMQGGELFVPKIPSMRVTDLAEALAPGRPLKDIGIRPGEKLHEEMIAVEDAHRTVEFDSYYVVQPVLAGWGFNDLAGDPVADGFRYASDSNTDWLSVDGLRSMVGQ